MFHDIGGAWKKSLMPTLEFEPNGRTDNIVPFDHAVYTLKCVSLKGFGLLRCFSIRKWALDGLTLMTLPLKTCLTLFSFPKMRC